MSHTKIPAHQPIRGSVGCRASTCGFPNPEGACLDVGDKGREGWGALLEARGAAKEASHWDGRKRRRSGPTNTESRLGRRQWPLPRAPRDPTHSSPACHLRHLPTTTCCTPNGRGRLLPASTSPAVASRVGQRRFAIPGRAWMGKRPKDFALVRSTDAGLPPKLISCHPADLINRHPHWSPGPLMRGFSRTLPSTENNIDTLI